MHRLGEDERRVRDIQAPVHAALTLRLQAREEFVKETGSRLDMLLTRTSAEAEGHDAEFWGEAQGAAWLDVLLNSLWPDLLSGLVQAVGPLVGDPVLAAYVNDGREVLHIPEFITALRVAKFGVGRVSPVSIRCVHVSRPGKPAHGDTVLDMQVEVLASDLDVQINAQLNDLVAPLLARFNLCSEDSSYLAIRVLDVAFSGTLRLRLSPGARMAAAGFTAEPSVALGLELAYHSKLGWERVLPISALPRVSDVLHAIVVKQVAEYALWPRCFVVDLAPPALLGVGPPGGPGPRAPAGRLRVTLLAARGVGRLLAASGGGAAWLRCRAVTGLEMKMHRCDSAGAPLLASACDAEAGTASWGAAGEGAALECDTFSPLGIEFCTLKLAGGGGAAAAQVKLQADGTGGTLFSHAGAQADDYGTLPQVTFSMTRDAFQAAFEAALPGRSASPCVAFADADGAMQAWLPLDGGAGELLVRLHMDWLYSAAAAAAAAAGGGGDAARRSPAGAEESPVVAPAAVPPKAAAGSVLSLFSASLVHAAMVQRTLYMHVSFSALRGGGLAATQRLRLALGRAGAWATSPRTRAFSARDFRTDALEVLCSASAEQPSVTLLEVRGGGGCGGPGRMQPLAEAVLPISILSAGQAAHWWLKLQPLQGLSPKRHAEVEELQLLVVVQLCAA